MPSSDHMNQLIRAGARPDPPDLNDHQAVNASIRQAAGVRTRPVLGPPPGPEVAPADFHAWADQAAEAGMDPTTLAAWTGRWVQDHRQHLADRRAER
jgi:hypothetical protein